MGNKASRPTFTWPEMIQIARDIEESGGAVYAAAAEESKGRARRTFAGFSAIKRKHAQTLTELRPQVPDGTIPITFNRMLLDYLER